jgi:hypothetical protein
VKGLALRIHGDVRGLAGKVALVAGLVFVSLGLFAMDAGSIMITKIHVDDLANQAASQAANTYKANQAHPSLACQAAVDLVTEDDSNAKIPSGGCVVNTNTGEVTVTVKKNASTLVAGKFEVTKRFTKVKETETNGPSSL